MLIDHSWKVEEKEDVAAEVAVRSTAEWAMQRAPVERGSGCSDRKRERQR